MGATEAVRVDDLRASAYVIPTDAPESDGTATWTKTTLVLVEVAAGGKQGIGYTYADRATALFVAEVLRERVLGADAMAIPSVWDAMVAGVRNHGRPGVAAMAISATDTALWDLKAKLLDVPLVALLGAARTAAAVYGSGGFTSYSIGRLCEQLGGWVSRGISCVKMKVGREPDRDLERVAAVRKAIGPGPQLFVDANGAYERKQALEFAGRFAELGVTWFEEPVSADDHEGLRLVRRGAPPPMRIAAGEYGYRPLYFRRMLDAQAVDVLQADATRCGGPTGFLRAGGLCDVWQTPLSAHCAPSLHLHPCLAAPRYLNLEYFHDHVRIEEMLFDGAPSPVAGVLRPDLTRPGLGLVFKPQDARKFAA